MPPEAAAPEAAPAQAPMDDMSSLMQAVKQSNEQALRPAAPQPDPAPEAKPQEPAPKKPAANPAKKAWEMDVQDPDAPESEAKAPEQEAPEPDMKPEAKTRWKELRAKENQLKDLLPQFDALKAELEQLKSAPREAPDEVKTELEDLRNFRAAYDVVNTPEYKNAVTVPFQDAQRRLQDVADFAKVDYQKLFQASGENNRLARNKIISSILSESEEEGVDASVIAEATAAINDMLPIFAKDEELRAKAGEMRTALEGRKTKETEAQRQQHEATMSKASKEMDDLLAPKFKAFKLFEDAEFAKRVSEARVADAATSPMDAAYQAKAGVLLPAVIEKFNALATEVKDLRKTLAARNGSSPTVTPSTPQLNEPRKPMSDEETFNSLMQAAKLSR